MTLPRHQSNCGLDKKEFALPRVKGGVTPSVLRHSGSCSPDALLPLTHDFHPTSHMSGSATIFVFTLNQKERKKEKKNKTERRGEGRSLSFKDMTKVAHLLPLASHWEILVTWSCKEIWAMHPKKSWIQL